ncbi:NfeD family protein [bacterium]|nr:NfeD family protein [bacterium]
METLQTVPPYQVLGAIGFIFALLEMAVAGFFMLPIGVAFLATALVALWVPSWNILLAVLAAFEVVSFLVLRRWFTSKMPSELPMNVQGMIGQECEVIETIGPQNPGYVKLYGDQWVAKSSAGREISKGERVVIEKIDGNKVWVKPLN